MTSFKCSVPFFGRLQFAHVSNIRVRSALNCKKSERLPAMTLSRHSHSKWYRAAIITSIKHRPKACLICSVLLSSSLHISSHACLPACLLGCLLGKWRYAVCVFCCNQVPICMFIWCTVNDLIAKIQRQEMMLVFYIKSKYTWIIEQSSRPR